MHIRGILPGRLLLVGAVALAAAGATWGKGERIGEFYEFGRSRDMITFKRCGTEPPFAEMSLKGFDAAELYARCEEGRPFIYVGVTPKGDAPATLKLPAITLKNQPAAQEL